MRRKDYRESGKKKELDYLCERETNVLVNKRVQIAAHALEKIASPANTRFIRVHRNTYKVYHDVSFRMRERAVLQS